MPRRLVALLVFATVLGAPAFPARYAAASAQAPQRHTLTAPRWRVEAAVSAASPFVRDGNGTTVRAGIAPALGVTAAWTIGPRSAALLGARASATPVRIDAGGRRYGGGTAVQGDLLAGLAWLGALPMSPARPLDVHAAVEAVVLRGPGDVVPFRFANHALAHAGGEIGAAVRLTTSRPLALTVTAQTFRLGATTAGDPVTRDGWVSRVLVGVRYGR